jgi:hypothetical protein
MRSLWLVLVLLCVMGCDPPPPAPRITALRYDGQAPDSTLVLLFSLDFEDDEGDLGEGSMETFINNRVAGLGLSSLRPMFLQSDVDLDATAGTLHFVVELAFAGAPERGSSFSVGVRLADNEDHVSRTVDTTLHIE